MKKEWFLILASILIIIYAVFLNCFFPVEAKKTKSFSGKNKAETGLKAEFKHGVNKNVSPEVSGLSFGYEGDWYGAYYCGFGNSSLDYYWCNSEAFSAGFAICGTVFFDFPFNYVWFIDWLVTVGD